MIVKMLIINIIYILDRITPNNKTSVTFFQSNDKFDDNAKILFNYMLEATNYEIYWLYENKKYSNENFIKRYSYKGLIFFLRSKYCVITHGSGDLGFYKKNTKKIVQLWHGTPIKMIGAYDRKLSQKSMIKMKKESAFYNLFIFGSDIEQYYVSSSMNLKKSKCLVSGLPRNDMLLNSNIKKPNFLKTIKSKLVLYAPTFRDFGETLFFPFKDTDFDIMDHVLKDLNVKILLRPHPNDLISIKKLVSIVAKYDSFIFARNNEVSDISELVPFVDCIVTDYSSIYIDLLLKDVPPIFIPYDLEEYDRVRGLAYDYELVTPGPKVLTQKEFINDIEDALNGAPKYKEKRQFVKKMFHKYEDGQACKRIVEAMEKLV